MGLRELRRVDETRETSGVGRGLTRGFGRPGRRGKVELLVQVGHSRPFTQRPRRLGDPYNAVHRS